jgi:hypothetical protein
MAPKNDYQRICTLRQIVDEIDPERGPKKGLAAKKRESPKNARSPLTLIWVTWGRIIVRVIVVFQQ